MVMKDYLSTTERLNIIAALKVAEMTEQFVQGDLFTAKEKRRSKEKRYLSS